MADCNIRNVPDELMRSMKIAALDRNITLRQWVIAALEAALQLDSILKHQKLARDRDPNEPSVALEDLGHNIKSCRIYRCTACIALGKKF